MAKNVVRDIGRLYSYSDRMSNPHNGDMSVLLLLLHLYCALSQLILRRRVTLQGLLSFKFQLSLLGDIQLSCH